jgi:mannose-1-phosphate guanylyltransferase
MLAKLTEGETRIMKVVLLAAGFGSRLWPLSTSGKPKQFQTLLGEKSLLQYTYELFSQVVSPQDIHILTLQGLEHWVYEQIPGLTPESVLLVPERRNTLPHTIFALKSITESSDEPVLFSGTDTYIPDAKVFIKDVKSCVGKTKKASDVITIVCSSAERTDTNAGYVQLKKDHIDSFTEKPSVKEIENLSQKGPLYKALSTYITSLDGLKHTTRSMDSKLAAHAKKLLAAGTEDLQESFLAMPFCDISNGVFSHASNLTACVTDSDFLDLGSYAALHQINDKDKKGNVILGKVILDGESANNFIANHTDQPLIVIDANNMVIIQTPWGNFVSPIDQADRVGEIYKQKIHIA